MLEGRVVGLTLALSTVVQGLLLADADARRELRDFLESSRKRIDIDLVMPKTAPHSVLFKTQALDVFDQLAVLLDVMLPENLG